MGTKGKKLPSRAKNRIGERHTRLVVVERVGTSSGGQAMWRCVCDCGGEVVAQGGDLKNYRSCGCYARESGSWNRRGNLKHGHTSGYSISGRRTQTPLYRTWSSMIQRCTNPRAQNYKWYGARGITICERWMTFENFAYDMGERPRGRYSIDRINNDGNYEPGNCRWATQSQQVHNSRRRGAVEVSNF